MGGMRTLALLILIPGGDAIKFTGNLGNGLLAFGHELLNLVRSVASQIREL